MNDTATFDAPAAPIVKFTPAVRKGSHVLIGIYGFSGCGKTLSAIYLARGLVGPKGRIAMIDTETGRGLVYAMEAGGFDHAELTPPFTPERYVEAIKQSEAAGYDALIIDSASHEWEGIGGIVETAEASGAKGLVKWASPKARHKKFVQHLLNTRMHIVICLRAKEKLVQVTPALAPRYPGAKVGDILSEGMISIQDKRFIYEQTVQLFLPLPEPGRPRGVPVLEKCPKDLLGAFPEGQQISVETGRRIAEWVAGGVPVDHAAETLKRSAEERAADGTEKMRAWWGGLAKEQQRQLAPHLPNLRSIADAADKEAARQAAAATNGDNDERLDDPFGLPPAAPGSIAAPPPKAAPAAPASNAEPPKRTAAAWQARRDAIIKSFRAECETQDELTLAYDAVKPELAHASDFTRTKVEHAFNERRDQIAAKQAAPA